MDGCIFRTKDGECDLYFEVGHYKTFCEMENCKDRKLSNADRIRAMTDEELAVFIEREIHGFAQPFCDVERENGSWCELDECDVCIRKWLKQEADE